MISRGNRREFCLVSAALLGHPLFMLGQDDRQFDRPWFDPEFGRLPTPEQQIANLTQRAQVVQENPKTVSMLPVTGLPTSLGTFDQQVTDKMRDGGHVGVTCAIAINGQLVVARGYGVLSSHDPVAASPMTPGYIGSITKPLCVMSALTLCKDRKLDLDARVLDVLPLEPLLKPGEVRQPEIETVTVRMLMNHTSGLFNIVERLFDRQFYAQLAAQGRLRLVHNEISQYDLVRRGLSIPYVSKPGTEAHYSGQGLQVLGRIVERLSSRRLDQFMEENMLTQCGVKNHATMSYLSPETRLAINRGLASTCGCFVPAMFDKNQRRSISWKFNDLDGPYGNHWGTADACGTSMMSVLDLLRFACQFPDVIGRQLFEEAMTIPKVDNNTFHGLGWGCRRIRGSHQFGHSGAIPGARAWCESTWDGIQYAILAAGEHDQSFERIKQLVLQLGRELKNRRTTASLWRDYGYPDSTRK